MANDDNGILPLKNFGTVVVELQQLIAAPLVATVEADFMAAQKFVEFIEKYGFFKRRDGSPPVDGGGADEPFGELRMISFYYYKPLPRAVPPPSSPPHLPEEGEEAFQLVRVKIPAISLIPLPLLQVKDAHFEFAIRIIDALEITADGDGGDGQAFDLLRAEPDGGDGEDGNDPLPDPDKYQVYATLARQTPRAETEADLAPHLEANMNIQVNMTQADIPAGIALILNLTQDSVYEVTHTPVLPVSPPEGVR